MPLKFNTPVTDYATPAEYAQITAFLVRVDIQLMLIYFLLGNITNGVFVPIKEEESIRIETNEMVAEMTKNVQEGLTVYENVKDALYTLLQSRTGWYGEVV